VTPIHTSDGVRLHHTDTGPSAGTTVVLVAGFSASALTWQLTVDALSEAGHRVVCLDRRNHGMSEAPEHGQRMARHGRDLDETLRALDLTDVVLVGGSMGASTIWAYLDQVGSAAGAGVRGIVSIDQTPRMLNADGWSHGFYGYERANAATLFEHGVGDTGHPGAPERTVAGLGRLMERLGLADPSALMALPSPPMLRLLQDHALQDWRDVVARCDAPLLMVAGDQSQFWPAEHAAAAAASATHGHHLVVESAGHAVNLDDPDAFNVALLEFVASL
jgi:non-heme chloroperoxidase